MRQLRLHAGKAFSAVLANSNYDVAAPPSKTAQWVTLPDAAGGRSEGRAEERGYDLFTGDLVDRDYPWRHDSRKLATRLMEVFEALASRRAQPGDKV
jgi:hypothetical protein